MILQGRNWPASGGWSQVAADAPVQPVYAMSGQGAIKDTISPAIAVTAGQTIAVEAWIRTTSQGNATTEAVGVWLNALISSSTRQYPPMIYLRPQDISAAWTPYRRLYVIPATVVSISAIITMRANALAGTYQVCGTRISIIGAMPAP